MTPRAPHMAAVKPIMRYLQGTLTHGLHIQVSPSISFTSYSNADWAGCPDTRRSTFWYCVFLGPNLISWSSKRKVSTSRCSAEAEYHDVTNATVETAWIRNLLLELHCPLQ